MTKDFHTDDLQAVECMFHDLIRKRTAEFGIHLKRAWRNGIPRIDSAFPVGKVSYLGIDGMYGGFSYWLAEREGSLLLVAESWSRVVGGSGQRHEITAAGCVKVEEGFV